MSSLWICLVVLGVASLVPGHVRAASLDSSAFQLLSVEEKAEAVRNAVSLLSVKAALLAARSGKEAAIQSELETGEASIMHREAESNLEGAFLKAIDCQLGLEPIRICEAKGDSGSAPDDAVVETLPETLPAATAPTAVSTEATRPSPGDSSTDVRGSRGVSVDLKASWTVSALQNGGENLLNDAELLSYLGRRAGEAVRDFLKAAAGGQLLEPSSKVPVEEFDEEKLGEVVRLAGKILGSLQLNLTQNSLTIDAETRSGYVRRLNTKDKEADVHRDCTGKSHKGKKCCGERKNKGCSEAKGKCCSEVKDKCCGGCKKKYSSGAKKSPGKNCSPASEQSLNVVQPAPITSAALPFYSPYPMVLQPQTVPLPAFTPIMYGVGNVGTAAVNAAGPPAAPLYNDGVWLFPLAQGADGGIHQPPGMSEGVYMVGGTGTAPAWRSNEFLPRLPATGRNPILQEIPPLLMGPISAINTHVQQSPLLSPLYRSALGRYLFDTQNAMHYDELQNFNMTRADLS